MTNKKRCCNDRNSVFLYILFKILLVFFAYKAAFFVKRVCDSSVFARNKTNSLCASCLCPFLNSVHKRAAYSLPNAICFYGNSQNINAFFRKEQLVIACVNISKHLALLVNGNKHRLVVLFERAFKAFFCFFKRIIVPHFVAA